MTKIKKILTFITAVMMLFALSIGFAGCKDEEEEKITYMIYVSDRQLTGLTNVTDAAIMEGVQLVCKLKDGDNKEVTIPYVEGSYIYVRFMIPENDFALCTCNGFRRYYLEYSTLDDQTQEIKPKTLERGIYRYRFVDDYPKDPLDRFCAWLKLIVE